MFDLLRGTLNGTIIEAGRAADGGHEFVVELTNGGRVRIPCDEWDVRDAAALLLAEIRVEVRVGRRSPHPCPGDSEPWFRGRWQDWHRGHGCEKDDGKPRSAAGTAEIAAGRADGKGTP